MIYAHASREGGRFLWMNNPKKNYYLMKSYYRLRIAWSGRPEDGKNTTIGRSNKVENNLAEIGILQIMEKH